MRYLLIFTLLVVACSDEIQKKCVPFVTISDLNPIQFWQADCDTYNEEESCGVHHKCWCQPWNCNDEINIQFSDSTESDYALRVINESGDVVDEVPFVPTVFEEDIFAGVPFSNWTNVPKGDGNPWTISNTPSVSISTLITGETSDYLRRPISLPAGTYTISYNITHLGGPGGVFFWVFRKNGVNVGSANRSSILSQVVSVTLSDSCDEILFYVGLSLSNSNTFTINEPFESITILRDPIFSVSYTPSELCDQKLRFEIVDLASPDTVLAKSDCIDVKSNHKCTTLIEYSNNRDFAGVVFADVSPEVSFKARIPAIFFHERFPEEDNVIQLSNSIVKTSGTLRAQRLMDIDYIPYYMHRKIQLILKLQTILINGLYWAKDEPYEMVEGDRRWPVKKARIYLSEKDYLQRAVL